MIDNNSVFLVSGGAKGITAECVIKLAQRYQCKFILLGRSTPEPEPVWAEGCGNEAELKKRIMEYFQAQGEKPTPAMVQKKFQAISSQRAITTTLKAIEETGGKAEYLSVDVTDAIALSEQITGAVERLGAVTGIIHGAGNLADKRIEKKSIQDFETVYAAKVKGLENLLRCVPPKQLQHLVLFSSVSGFYGNIGQSDYAIANEILNKSAHLMKQYNPDCHVVAINWGAWDSGMVTPEIKKAFAERGIDIIPVDVGTQMLVNELHPSHRDSTQVVIGSPIIPPAVTLDPQLCSYRIRRHLSVDANPFLLDHVIAGTPVLPATCAISWMIHACEECYPGYCYFSCKNFKVLKGITFNHTLAKEYIIEIQEITKHGSESIEFQTTILSKTPLGKTYYHFRANITIVRQLPEVPMYDSVDLTEDNNITITGKDFYQNRDSFLFHGAAFQQITRVINISPEKITTKCLWSEITLKAQGQFPVKSYNPYIGDLSTQALWVWLSHYHQEVCLPGQITNLEEFIPVPYNEPFYVSCEILNKTATSVTANLMLHNSDGKLYSRILGAKAVIAPMNLHKPK
ncbi:SDR family NAD(P)-dependent oxidoreductase [Anabaena sp. CCY 9402-a]|uniref:SDR family NAD(P)-dependent oxidoreductase n=1 Tax=Anabaena sp. CCY 9402-a TaxID=3103867 RepID=UPI0039C60645